MQMHGKAFILFGVVVIGLIGLFFLSAIYPADILPLKPIERLKDWQTLVAGFLALVGGSFVLLAAMVQFQNDRTERDEAKINQTKGVAQLLAAEVNTIVNECISIAQNAESSLADYGPLGLGVQNNPKTAAAELPEPVGFNSVVDSIGGMSPTVVEDVVGFYNSARLYNRLLRECDDSRQCDQLAASQCFALSLLGLRLSMRLSRYSQIVGASVARNDAQLSVNFDEWLGEVRKRRIPLDRLLTDNGYDVDDFRNGRVSLPDLVRASREQDV